ncbi:hypothetical protein M1O56_04955 [Dehalococcoidia bacterium]|nr:hypothetical protein [Dehalococcoidia bacterium]
MSRLLSKSHGLHSYNPAKFPGAVFLDVADAQYNPLNPEEITNVARSGDFSCLDN